MRKNTRKLLQIILVIGCLPILMKIWNSYRTPPYTINNRRVYHVEKFTNDVVDKQSGVEKMAIPQDKPSNLPSRPEVGQQNVKQEVPYIFDPVLEKIDDKTGTCNKELCNPVKEGMLNIHILPHTHDDVGWLKTMDQYFTGRGGGNKESSYHGGECVQCILNSVIPALLKSPKRRFHYVEMSFFSRWYYSQTPEMREDVKKLIRERRLELTVGGWCMSDAATTYYNDIIDQHTVGFEFILKEFGKCALPRVGWHIDQFGHSSEHSSIFAQMGFDGLFLGRIDDQDKAYRIKNRNMEMVWRASPNNLGDSAALFTSILYDFYMSPSGMYFEGFPASHIQGPTAKSYADRFIALGKERSGGFKSNHVLIPFGGDFAYRSAEGYLGVLENIIERVNQMQAEGSKVHALFSTPACYVNAVNKDSVSFQAKEDDFFPYSIIPASHWTGYFVSRAGLKLHVKHASSLLQTCKELSALTGLTNTFNTTQILREAVAVLQHHDAITGTEKQHVTDDYNLMLSSGEKACQTVINEAYQKIMYDNGMEKPQHEFCPMLNVSVCPFTETMEKGVVTLFNPLSHTVTSWLRLPVRANSASVTNPEGQTLNTQIVPISQETLKIPERMSSAATSELVFKATVPPHGFSSYYLEMNKGSSQLTSTVKDSSTSGQLDLSNGHIGLTIDRSTGKLSTLTNVDAGINIKIDQEFMFYLADVGQPRNPMVRTLYGNHRRASGAYTFVPKLNTKPELMRGSSSVSYSVVNGRNVQEVHQQFNKWTSQVIRLYEGAKYLELEWTVGPIDIDDRQGREVVSHFATDLNTKGLWYTDSNGREMMERKRDYRASWPLNVTDKVSGNYYPITNKISLRDLEKNLQLTLVNDRSQGGGSIEDGGFEVMVHRRLLHDDDLGVVEPLNEKGADGKGIIYRGKHYLLLERIGDANNIYRQFGLQVHMPPTISFIKVTSDIHAWQSQNLMKWSGIRGELPPNVNLLTLDQVYNGGNMKLLIRLENFYEVSDNTNSPKTASVDLERLFVPFNIVQVNEVGLGGNVRISDIQRLKWKTEDGRVTPSNIGTEASKDTLDRPFTVVLKPMEIRTFRVITGPSTEEQKFLGIF